MDATEQVRPDGRIAHAKDALKSKLGDLGRRAKRIELHQTIADHPLHAIGIGFALGAVVGLVRPKPTPSRLSNAVIATLGAIALRLIRETALRQIGEIARQWLERSGDQPEQRSTNEVDDTIYGDP